MIRPITFFFLLSALHGTCACAQKIIFNPAYPVVENLDNQALPLAWMGGLNAPQPQRAQMDGDDIEDIIIFDRAGQVLLGLKGQADSTYTIAPDLVEFFPQDIEGWMLLRDYNTDGITDIFTYSPQLDGIRVFKGHRRDDGRLGFTLKEFGDPLPQLYFPLPEGGRANIFVSRIDYPAVVDHDFDGDLDILTFGVAGGYVEYYENLAADRGYPADTLVYRLTTQCWGGFFESGLTTALDLAPVQGACYDALQSPGGGGRPRHSGSTVSLFDMDGNGLNDILLGDISFDKLVVGYNGGTLEEAWINSQDIAWPNGGHTLEIPSFPASFLLDYNGDGAIDLLAAPTVTLNVEDVNVLWYYENTGTTENPAFEFRDSQLLVRDMIDLGTSAYPATFDYDADGRMDLVVGNNVDYTGSNYLSSQLRLYRNVTPPGGDVAFELIDDDYLELTRYQTTTWAFTPTFGDLDNDGDVDIVIGDRKGNLMYGENIAGAGQPAQFAPFIFEWMNLDAGQYAKPHIADLDRDGKADLLVGGFDGRIRFYHNNGTAEEPLFNDDIATGGNVIQLGGINTNRPGISTGHPAPLVVTNEAYTLILAGNRSGTLEAYRFGTDSTYMSMFTQLSQAVDNLDVGAFAAPALADFDNDGKLDCVVGNERGGLQYYKTNLNLQASTSVQMFEKQAFLLSVFPNPAQNQIVIKGWQAHDEVTDWALLDMQGRTVRKGRVSSLAEQVQCSVFGLAPAVYVVRVRSKNGVALSRVIVTQ